MNNNLLCESRSGEIDPDVGSLLERKLLEFARRAVRPDRFEESLDVAVGRRGLEIRIPVDLAAGIDSAHQGAVAEQVLTAIGFDNLRAPVEGLTGISRDEFGDDDLLHCFLLMPGLYIRLQFDFAALRSV